METAKQPKFIVRYLTLGESVRLLIETGTSSVRDNCIISIFLNCALRLSKLASLNVGHVNSELLSIIGKGNKESKFHLTPTVKQALAHWFQLRNAMYINSDALLISCNSGRLTTRAIQNVVKKHIIAAGLNPESLSTQFAPYYSYAYVQICRIDIRSLQQLLSHESIATTEIYTHDDDSQLKAAVNANPLAMMFS